MQVRWRAIVGCAGIALCASSTLPVLAHAADTAQYSNGVRVLAYEPFVPYTPAAPGNQASRKADRGTLVRLGFDAYGRRFELELEKNTRLIRALDLTPADGPTLTLYQGKLQNVQGSWVRLSAQGQAIRGMIWDGRELYVVELAQALRDALPAGQPGNQAKSSRTDSVIFRLSDTEIAPGSSFCGQNQDTAPSNGKASYSQLLSELKGSAALMQTAGASLRLQLSALGDALFRQRYGTEQQARDEILVRLNNVDGIFSSELGVEIQVPTLQIKDAATDPFSSTTVPNALLSELATLRRNTPELRARGLTHLFTGRNLDGDTVGIAYTDTLCAAQGAGLTEVTGRTAWLESLIAAHEIGHNFGAVHDGEGPCSSTPQGQYLMSPRVAENAVSFSQCSRDTMLPRIHSASCITPLTLPDLSIPADLGTQRVALAKPFDWELTIRNTGGSTAAGAAVRLLVTPAITVDEAWVPGRSCTSGGGMILCDLGDIAAAGSRVVHLVLRSEVPGSNSISAQVEAQSDADLSNNSGAGTLIFAPEADLGISLQVPAQLESGTSANVSFTVDNQAPIDAADVTVSLAVSGVTATAASLGAGTCSVAATSVTCTLSSLAAQSSLTGTLTITGSTAGSARIQASVSSSYVDPNSANDSSSNDLTVVESSETHAPGNRGGGGGSSDALFLVSLAGLLAALRIVRRPA